MHETKLSPAKQTRKFTLLELAFRPCFLLSALYAIWLLVRWALTLSGLWQWPLDIPLFAWHAHEFQFGFALFVVLGFLLTAAQTWTGQPSITGKPLLLLMCLWLIARLAMNQNFYSLLISALADSSVIMISIGVLLRMVLVSKNYKNLIFAPILLVFLSLHLGHLYAMHINDLALSKQVSYATSWWFVLLISLIGSRVIPFFISNAVGVPVKRESIKFTLCTQLLILAIFILTLLGEFNGVRALCMVALATHLYRLYLWHHQNIWQNPMLWSLYLSYSFLPLALFSVVFLDSYANAMHLINLGFIGAMILSFTSRVSLGHTGRKIETTLLTTSSFLLIFIASISRGLGVMYFPAVSQEIMSFAAICWLCALLCFLFRFTPILLKPRADSNGA